MQHKIIPLTNRLGLHARAAAKLATMAQKFSSIIIIERNGKTVNAKSIMGIMMLAATYGSSVEITIDGDDEQLAMSAISQLFANRFDEAE